jgi:hypothetical protein
MNKFIFVLVFYIVMSVDFNAIVKIFLTVLLGIVGLGLVLFFLSEMLNRSDIGVPILIIAIIALAVYIYTKIIDQRK